MNYLIENLIYYINTSATWAFPRKLHIFTREDNMLISSHVKRSPSLWLNNKSCLWKQAHLVFHWCLYNKQYYILAYGYEFCLLVFNSISHLFAALTREISSWSLEDEIHIHARACNILYLSDKLLGKGANRLGTQGALARREPQDVQDSCHL